MPGDSEPPEDEQAKPVVGDQLAHLECTRVQFDGMREVAATFHERSQPVGRVRNAARVAAPLVRRDHRLELSLGVVELAALHRDPREVVARERNAQGIVKFLVHG